MITLKAHEWIERADDLLAHGPISEVKLTTYPSFSFFGLEEGCRLNPGRDGRLWLTSQVRWTPKGAVEGAQQALSAEWPGITFHLPEPKDDRWESDNAIGVAHHIMKK